MILVVTAPLWIVFAFLLIRLAFALVFGGLMIAGALLRVAVVSVFTIYKNFGFMWGTATIAGVLAFVYAINQ